jgi:HEAT repeat protein
MMNDPTTPNADDDLDALIEGALEAVTPTGWTDYEYGQAHSAIYALHSHADLESVFQAAKRLTREVDPRRRRLGATILGQLGHTAWGRREPSFVDERLEALVGLLSEKGPGASAVIADAVTALGHLRDPRIVALVARLREHANADVRRAVAVALGGHDEAQETLIVLSGDVDAAVRDWATFGLSRQSDADGPALRAALRARLDDVDPDVRVEAISGLARRRDAAGIAALALALPEDSATPLLEAAVELADPKLCEALRQCEANGRPWPDYVECAWREAWDACGCDESRPAPAVSLTCEARAPKT